MDTEFFWEVDLFFSDLKNLGGLDKWETLEDDLESKAKFNKVCTQVFSIKSLARGVFDSVPVNFENSYFSLMKA